MTPLPPTTPSQDRREVLKTLVPGTDRWYYFQELLSEQEGA